MVGNVIILVLIIMILINQIVSAKNKLNGTQHRTDVVVITHGKELMDFNCGVVIVLIIIIF